MTFILKDLKPQSQLFVRASTGGPLADFDKNHDTQVFFFDLKGQTLPVSTHGGFGHAQQSPGFPYEVWKRTQQLRFA